MVRDTEENQPTGSSAEVPTSTTTEDTMTSQAEIDRNLQDQQLAAIEDEQKATPLVTDKLPFALVTAEYNPESSAEFYNNTIVLSDTYDQVRFIRGDGNCFYRCIMTGITEVFLKDKQRLSDFITLSREWVKQLIALGFPEWTCSDFCDYWIDFLEGIQKNEITEKKAFADYFRVDASANYMLMFFRLVTSGNMKKNAGDYQNFLVDRTVDEYCANDVESMWKDADHIAIDALVKALNIQLRVEYVDRTMGPNSGRAYNIPESDKEPDMYLLYRPGHYDLIYKKI